MSKTQSSSINPNQEGQRHYLEAKILKSIGRFCREQIEIMQS